jgi:hypothetical protein
VITAETITDEQIRELGLELRMSGRFLTMAMWCDYALLEPDVRVYVPRGCERDAARAQVASFLNARSAK